MFKKSILFSLAVLAAPVALADQVDPDKVIQKTVELLVSGKTNDAFNFAIKSNPYFMDMKAQIDASRISFETLVKDVGSPNKCEKLVSRNLIQRFRTDVYLCLSPKRPFEITFEFYNEKNAWRIQSFSATSKVDEYIQQAIEIDIGKQSAVKQVAD